MSELADKIKDAFIEGYGCAALEYDNNKDHWEAVWPFSQACADARTPTDWQDIESARKVKPLEWRIDVGAGFHSVWRGTSDVGIGRYTVVGEHWWGPEPTNEYHDAADPDSAKAAAQADYESRILSALVAPPASSNGEARDDR